MRYSDWPTRLQAELDAAETRRFEYGYHDCCVFAARCIQAMTGVNLAFRWQGCYHALEDVDHVLKDCGGLIGLVEMIAAEVGMEEVPPAFAQRGDLALIVTESGPALAICVGAELIAARAPAGLASVPAGAAQRAWRI